MGDFSTLGGRGRSTKTYLFKPFSTYICNFKFDVSPTKVKLSSQGSLVGAARPAVRAAFSIKADCSVSQIEERWLCLDKPDHEEIS